MAIYNSGVSCGQYRILSESCVNTPDSVGVTCQYSDTKQSGFYQLSSPISERARLSPISNGIEHTGNEPLIGKCVAHAVSVRENQELLNASQSSAVLERRD
jgi:hypothetical protein